MEQERSEGMEVRGQEALSATKGSHSSFDM